MLLLRIALLAPVVAFARVATAGTPVADPIPDPPLVDEPADPDPAEPDASTTLPSPPPPVIDAHGVAPTTPTHRRGTGEFVIGVGFSPDDHFIAHAAVVQNNLFHTGQRLSLSADVAELQQRFVLAHDLPNIIPGYDLHTELFSARRVYPGFTREGAGGSMALSHRIDRANRVYARYRIERVTTDLMPTEAARTNDNSYRSAATIATIGAGFIHDTLDTEFLPRHGTRFELYTDRAARRLGSDYDFQRTGASIGHARSLGPMTLRFEGHATYIHSNDPMGVALSERLLHDGHVDVRGYGLDGSLGSNFEAVGRVELEVPVWKRAGISLAGWADAGLSENTDAMYGPTDSPLLRRSVGLSLIWRSPLGPLRFDFAVPLDGKSRSGQFLFGLGGYF